MNKFQVTESNVSFTPEPAVQVSAALLEQQAMSQPASPVPACFFCPSTLGQCEPFHTRYGAEKERALQEEEL